MSIISGSFVADAYDFVRKKKFWMAIGFLVIFAGFVFLYGFDKLNTMGSVKQFSTGFLEGCKWIKFNTPEDSLIFTIYGHPTAYNCERAIQSDVPDKANIVLGNIEESYQRLQQHGFDYIYVQQFAVTAEPFLQTFLLSFISSLDSSSHFKKVYDNTNLYGNNGVVLYQVL